MLAILSNSPKLEENGVSKLFGKAPYVLLVHQDGRVDSLKNEFQSGKELANELVKKGITTVITGHLGANPYQILSSNGVKILHNSERASVLASLEAFKNGTLSAFDESLIQEPKHRNEGKCEHSEGEGHECCEHEHKHGDKKCCDSDDVGMAEKRRKRCCQEN